jgi:Uma2 family endonuclease
MTEEVPFLTVEEYLEGEQHSEIRHEYFDGRVFAMAVRPTFIN